MKYMIHSCNSRQWYVDKYLIPSMIKQGIKEEDINVHQDKEGKGNLKSWIESASSAFIIDNPDGVTWHLQDDVVISSVFKKETENNSYDRFDIVCGFICKYDEGRKAGVGVVIKDLWYSFPCIKIANKLMMEFSEWAEINLYKDPQFGYWIRQKKGDDFVFRVFLEENYPTMPVLNLDPNLVDHIDYLLGGSIVNRIRGNTEVRSIYWKEPETVKELEQKILKERLVIK